MKKFKCSVCGFVWDGDEPPVNCPKCGAPKEKFEQLDDKAAELIERSRHTNLLHCQAAGLAKRIEELCKDGINDNLDPACVNVFRKSLNYCYEIMKLSMTEMQSHMNKGKWG
jgi:hypothetical protein